MGRSWREEVEKIKSIVNRELSKIFDLDDLSPKNGPKNKKESFKK